jgi:hypothetical protein
MAGRSSSRGHRWAIAASFAAQAAVIAVIAAASGTASAVHPPSAPLAAAPSAAPGHLEPAEAAPVPALPVARGMIGVTLTVAQPGGRTQSGDITFPAPEDPPRFAVKPGAGITITLRLDVPAGGPVLGLWAGVAPGQWAGGPAGVQRRLLASGRPLGPGQYSFTLHWALPAGPRGGDGDLLVLGVARPGPAQAAPVAEFAAG